MAIINTVFDFNRELQAGPYMWPGGYPRFFVTNDGGVLSFKATEENAGMIRDSIIANSKDGWRVECVEINWEDRELYCDHTDERITPAYQWP